MLMISDAARFFESFFRKLGEEGIPFAILHGYELFPERMTSDVDYVVWSRDLPRLLTIQREVAKTLGWVLASVVQAKLHAQFAVFFDLKNPSKFIQLDACGHYVERGSFIMRDEQMLNGRQAHRFMWSPAPSAEFGYVLAKSLIKRKPLEPHLARLRKFWETDPVGTEQIFHSLVGGSAGELESWFSQPALEWEKKLLPRIRARTRFGPLNLAKEACRAIRRILRPAGMRIAIMGPDGVGKSTLIAQLCLPVFRRMKQFHFRPGILDRKSNGPPVTEPHGEAPRSLAASLAKTGYYFIDHWLGHVLRTYPAKVRNELVVFDRTFEDTVIDPKRFRLAGAETLARWLSYCLPRPDLTIILEAEPEIIHARKPELTIAELNRQREALRNFADRTPRCVVVSANQAPEEVARAVQIHMIEFLTQREARRHPG